MREQQLVEIEYQKEADSEPSTRLVEPYSFGRELPNWYVHTWDRTSDGERSFRLDRMRSATLTKEHFEPRPGFEPTKLRNARTAQILYAKDVARFATERGARRLDGRDRPRRSARTATTSGSRARSSPARGDAVLLEPDELRRRIAARAKTLAKELGVERLRVRA